MAGPKRKGKKKPKASQPKDNLEDFMEVGGSPVPGITLRRILSGHTDVIFRIA